MKSHHFLVLLFGVFSYANDPEMTVNLLDPLKGEAEIVYRFDYYKRYGGSPGHLVDYPSAGFPFKSVEIQEVRELNFNIKVKHSLIASENKRAGFSGQSLQLDFSPPPENCKYLFEVKLKAQMNATPAGNVATLEFGLIKPGYIVLPKGWVVVSLNTAFHSEELEGRVVIGISNVNSDDFFKLKMVKI